MNGLFSAVPDGQGVVRNAKSGVYKQVKLFEREGELFAGMSGGFISLRSEGRTSNPHIIWEYVDVEYSQPDRLAGGLRYQRAEPKRVVPLRSV